MAPRESSAAGRARVEARSVRRLGSTAEHDLVAVEAPLSIVLEYGDPGERQQQAIATTMRTPGDDTALAMGWLLAEDIVEAAEIQSIRECSSGERVRVILRSGVLPRVEPAARYGLITSACGVCGRELLHAIEERSANPDMRMTAQALLRAAARLSDGQPGFRHTGGLHAAAFSDSRGDLLDVREDIGRHNALDKLIGGAHLGGRPDRLASGAVLVSSRASFELVQKASRARVPILAAAGAPSTLAIDAAERAGMTLVGFLREGRMNLYTRADRIIE